MSESVVETARLGMRRLTEAGRPVLAGLDRLETDRLLARCLVQYETRGQALDAARPGALEAVAGAGA